MTTKLDKDALTKLLANYENQLSSLLEQQRLLGNQTPAYVVTDIENLENRIDLVRDQLETMGGSSLSRSINTGGGAYVKGNVRIEGGDFIGRDKIAGDKISTGNITGGTGIAIGSNARSVAVTQQSLLENDLNQIFAPIMIALQSVPVDKQREVIGMIERLRTEVAKGAHADDGRLCDLITVLVERAPETKNALITQLLPLPVGPMSGRVLRLLATNS